MIVQNRGQCDGWPSGHRRACSSAVRATRSRCSCSPSSASLRSTSPSQPDACVPSARTSSATSASENPTFAQEEEDADLGHRRLGVATPARLARLGSDQAELVVVAKRSRGDAGSCSQLADRKETSH